MPVKQDPSGRRSVQAEAEVSGTPEQVWQAIATGPGISSWFVPTEMHPGGGSAPATTTSHFSADGSMDAVSAITEWDPPRRYVAESPAESPNAPAVATEWTVEARAGGTCIVRVVHSWFASSDEWDDQFEGHTHGWTGFFRILRLSLAHFAGQPSSAFQLMAFAPAPAPHAWKSLTGALGLSGAVAGEPIASASSAPRLSGHVERVGSDAFPEVLLRLDEPAPGVAHLFAMPMGGNVCLSIRIYLFGDRSPSAAMREEPAWRGWLDHQFPPSPVGE